MIWVQVLLGMNDVGPGAIGEDNILGTGAAHRSASDNSCALIVMGESICKSEGVGEGAKGGTVAGTTGAVPGRTSVARSPLSMASVRPWIMLTIRSVTRSPCAG